VIWYVIPARKNSKGVPYKNRKLFNFTASTIPKDLKQQVIVTSDDEVIQNLAKQHGFKVRKRPAENSKDDTNIRDVVQDVVHFFSLKKNDTIVLLYLTSPCREYEDIEKAIKFYKNKKAKSLLCKVDLPTSPYLCFYELDGDKGEKIIDHDLYRRQDYRRCFALSHYVCMVNVGFLSMVDKNLVSEQTVFMKIDDPIDINTRQDIEKMLKTKDKK